MRIETALLASRVKAENGMLTLEGGGPESVGVPAIPTETYISIGIIVLLEDAEIGHEQRIGLSWRDAMGVELRGDSFSFTRNPRMKPKGAPWRSGFGFDFLVPVKQTGRHTLALTVEDATRDGFEIPVGVVLDRDNN